MKTEINWHKEKRWKDFPNESCPYCGDEVKILSPCWAEDDKYGMVYAQDGDKATCMANCGWEGCVTADEDSCYLQDGNLDVLEYDDERKKEIAMDFLNWVNDNNYERRYVPVQEPNLKYQWFHRDEPIVLTGEELWEKFVESKEVKK